MVNGLSMENVSSSFAIQTLKSCGKTANIVSVPCGGMGASVMRGPHHARVPGSPVPHTLGFPFRVWNLL